MSLRQLSIGLSYRSGRDNLIQDFLVPCMQKSVLYRRSAGYFTSYGLALAARGVASLVKNGGEMHLVVSPKLEKEDEDALQSAIENPEEVLAKIVQKSLFDVEDSLTKDRLNALAWLAVTGHLKLKLALRIDENRRICRGIYHEKVGIFSDQEGNHVAFNGSANETAGGFIENFESIDAFRSWHDAEGRVEEKIQNFEALWKNETPGLKTFDFSQASKNLLEIFRNPQQFPDIDGLGEINEKAQYREFNSPQWLHLHDYQEEAIKQWAKNGGKGIFAMATGSGKTLTALSLACRVAKKNKPIVIVVVCPFINLCNQWIEEMVDFGLNPVPCYEGRARWEQHLSHEYQALFAEVTSVVAIVTTTRTFQSEAFQTKLRPRINSHHHLLIADEVHNLGAGKIQRHLPEGIRLRVGLSATPERHHDPEGTQAIFDYFGGIIYEYPISRAIAEGRLCPYTYHPHLVTLTEDEAIEYQEITEKLGRLLRHNDEDSEMGQAAMNLLIRRSRLLAGAENKMIVLDQVLRELPERPKKALFYCGDGRTTDQIAQEEKRQIEAVSRLLGETHGLRVRNFTYRESTEDRESILQDLGTGFLDGVVAIRCLDEGIDLPDLRMGFLLASSTNPRQFVQRRGRLLRKAPGKDLAVIHDFIIEPPDFGGSLADEAYNLERRFFRRELERIKDFCNTAENGAAALNALKDLRLKYNSISI